MTFTSPHWPEAIALIEIVISKGKTISIGPNFEATISNSAAPVYGVEIERRANDPAIAVIAACTAALNRVPLLTED